MFLNDDIVHIEKPCSPTFVVNESPDYFYMHPSFLLNIQDLHK